MKISLDQGCHFFAPDCFMFKHFVSLGSNTLHFRLYPSWLSQTPGIKIFKDALQICDVLEGPSVTARTTLVGEMGPEMFLKSETYFVGQRTNKAQLNTGKNLQTNKSPVSLFYG